jgi:hypothetical protein
MQKTPMESSGCISDSRGSLITQHGNSIAPGARFLTFLNDSPIEGLELPGDESDYR